MAKTLVDRIWESHVVQESRASRTLLYIDLHLVHEVTSPQAFEGLRLAGRRSGGPTSPSRRWITTCRRTRPGDGPARATQLEALREELRRVRCPLYATGSGREGIVHVIGPELGLTQPGMTIVCGDSHTSTHGAFGALAFGIGTSEVEHVLATQCLPQREPRTMRIVRGDAAARVTPRTDPRRDRPDRGRRAARATSSSTRAIAIRALSMEGRMTVCNMSIEAGARAGMIAPDDTTFAYLEGRPARTEGRRLGARARRVARAADGRRAVFDSEIVVDVERSSLRSPGERTRDGRPVDRCVPDPADARDADERGAIERALAYMELEPGTAIRDIQIDRVFIGSCTNSRIEDLRAAAAVVPRPARRRRRARARRARLGAGEGQAEAEGLDRIFKDAGFEWREAGCSMCLGMNPDVLPPGERCASTSNRNFEGRQGRGGRTHLVSPEMAAAAAIAGHFVDVRDWTASRL